MKEEEMLEIVDDFLENPFSYFRETMGKDTMQIYALSISVLRDLYNYEKEKLEQLEKENKELKEQKINLSEEIIIAKNSVKPLPNFYDYYNVIPKSKIEDKIKELIKEADYRTEDNPKGRIHFEAEPVYYQIAILQELLEEQNWYHFVTSSKEE